METLTSHDISDLLEKYRGDPASLISVLNEVQEKFKYLPYSVLEQVSISLKVSMAKIYGIVTFYHHYKLEKPGKYLIRCCEGTACHVKNSNMIINTLDLDYNIKIGQTTDDGLFSMEQVACMGGCALAPIVEINGERHGKMDHKKIKRLIREIKKKEEKE